MKNQQLNRNPFPNIILGDWHEDIVKVELDDCFTKRQAEHVGHMLNNRFNLDGFRAFQSSVKTHNVKNIEGDKIVYKYRTRGYHLVFNRKVTESEYRSIISWLYLHLRNNWCIAENLDEWIHMQNIKQTVTLRIGFKGKKKPPREVYRFGSQDKMIAKFIENKEFILDLMRRLRK